MAALEIHQIVPALVSIAPVPDLELGSNAAANVTYHMQLEAEEQPLEVLPNQPHPLSTNVPAVAQRMTHRYRHGIDQVSDSASGATRSREAAHRSE